MSKETVLSDHSETSESNELRSETCETWQQEKRFDTLFGEPLTRWSVESAIVGVPSPQQPLNKRISHCEHDEQFLATCTAVINGKDEKSLWLPKVRNLSRNRE